MSLKAKLVTTIAALCMVLCLLVGGVWAASQVKVNINGTVSFTANDVHATVSASSAGTTAETAKSDSVTFNCASTAADSDNKGETDTFDFSGMIFLNKSTDIVITITVSNLGERALTATVAEGTLPEGKTANPNVTVTIAETTQTAGTVAAKTGTATWTVTLHVVDTNLSVEDAPFAIVVTLTDANHTNS